MNLKAPTMPPALGPDDYRRAAGQLGATVAQVMAVKDVESNGGWFADMRAEILDLDGPGGFLDGPFLPKILFEAHLFSADTGGRFDASHPQISSRTWNSKLYRGGQAEYARLHLAMTLDRTAALRSASWGLFQILGRNHALCGFATVEAYVASVKRDEAAHLAAFCAFVRSSGLMAAFRKISNRPADCAAFARGYNGPAYAKHDYHGRIAAAHKRRSA